MFPFLITRDFSIQPDLLINFNLHDFWNSYEGVNPDRELQNFYKNLGIFAGLLLLAAVNMEQTDKSE